MFCPKCGAKIPDSANNCSYCGHKIERVVVPPVTNNNPVKEVKKENVLLGIVGALIGSIVGVGIVVLLSFVGFIASVAGLVMGICTLKLYEKFAGAISKKGVIICIVIMILMTVLAENIAFSIQVMNELGEKGYSGDFFDIFFNLYYYMGQGYLNTSTYVTNLVMVLAFNVLGSFGYIKEYLTKK
ncbi:MAG: zinc ribbon domain-containing protein [Bacilli bacterium]|nr:zinc ribbon domain-containing protein [Bacilli bacterium]